MNYYELLGVDRKATNEEIKDAYKKQMKKWHPDINKSEDAINMSSKINEAKEILLDELKRKDYDNYLDNKVKEDYNRYTQRKTQSTEVKKEESTGVTKWQYLKDWLKYSNLPFFRKFIGLIGVLLESFVCFIIKYLLIAIAYICFFLSDLIRELYSYVYAFVIIFILYTIYLYSVNTHNAFINEHMNEFKGSIIMIGVYVLSYILPVIGIKILSQEVFNFLYNKLDINLFKYCVGYEKK